jgi:hypothetical protein
MWWAFPVALAVPPDKQVANLEVGQAQIERFAVSSDGRFVVGRDARTNGENAWILDIDSWAYATAEPCQVAAAAVRPADPDIPEVWLACSDGTLKALLWADGALQTGYDAEGVPVSIPLDSGLAGLWYAPAPLDLLVGLSFVGDAGVLHSYSPADGLVDQAAGFPVQLPIAEGYSSLLEGNLVETAFGSQLVLAHGSDRVTVVTLASGALSQDVGFFAIEPVDVTPNLSGGLLAVDADGQLAQYFPSNSQWTYLTALDVTDIQPQAIVVNPTVGDEWFVVFGDQVKVWEMLNGAFPSPEPYWVSGDLLNIVHDGVAFDNYVFGGGEGGGLRVITARPWIDPATLEVAPTLAADGDEVVVSWSVDEAASWSLYLGGDRRGLGGRRLASGEAEAGASTAVPVQVAGNDWVEGDNALYVVATDGTGLTGHGRVDVVVDNPPTTPVLGPAGLGFADRRLFVRFDGIPDADLARYDVYVSTTPFRAEDWPSGGPSERIRGVQYPVAVTAEPGAAVDHELFPLNNDVAYWVAVRAVDEGGKESGMSAVRTETPRPGEGAADLAGEAGGAPCQTGGGASRAGWGLVALALAGSRRARPGRRASALAVGLLASAAARAEEPTREPFWKMHDLGPQRADVEIRYGTARWDDPALQAVYDQKGGPGVGQLVVEAGPQFGRVVEVDFSAGFAQERGQSVSLDTATGAYVDTAEYAMITAYPLALDGTFRLQILDEQIVVPHIRAGVDWVFWHEAEQLGAPINPVFSLPDPSDAAATGTGTGTDSASTVKTKVSGSKLGAHWGVGGGLLLDVLAPRRASLLEAQTGVNDTYLVFDWRKQTIDDRSAWWKSGTGQGLTFTGTVFTIGVKLDY